MKKVVFIVLSLVLLLFNLSNALHESFTDEYDNLLGGAVINKGGFLYKGFFSNHGPVAYYLAAGIELISQRDFFNFRVIYQNIIWTVEVLLIYFLLKRYGIKTGIELGVYFILVAICANFFWGYLLVADNLAGMFLTAAYILLFYSLFKQKVLSVFSVSLISLLCFLTLFTSLTYFYVVLFSYIFLFFNYSLKREYLTRASLLKIGLSLSLPFLLLGIYLVFTDSWSDFYFQTVTFNKQYYVYGEAAKAKNAFDLGYLLLIKALVKYRDLLFSFNQFNTKFPFMPTLLLSNTVLWLYLLLTKRLKLFLFSLLSVVYTNARNNPFSPGPLDFHSSAYIFVSLFNGVFVLFNLWSILKTRLNLLVKLLFGGVSALLIVYSISFFQFFYNRWWVIMQDKLTSQEPLYQIHPVSPFLDSLINPDDYYLIGPYDPQSNFYTKAKSTSRYYYLMPAMDQVPKIKQELIADIDKNKPKIIIYHTEMHILGVEPGKDFINYIKRDYVNLEDLKTYEHLKYTPKVKFLAGFQYDFERHFFVRRENLDEIQKKMVASGYLDYFGSQSQ